MSRYFTQPRTRVRAFNPDDDTPLVPNLSVSDHEPIDTGLIDERGDPIMRAPEPIGFHRPDGGSAF